MRHISYMITLVSQGELTKNRLMSSGPKGRKITFISFYVRIPSVTTLHIDLSVSEEFQLVAQRRPCCVEHTNDRNGVTLNTRLRITIQDRASHRIDIVMIDSRPV